MKVQIIAKDGKPKYAVLPYTDYLRLLEALKDKSDATTVADFHESYWSGHEFLVPAEILRRELASKSSIKLWREQRGFTRPKLAGQAGISKP